MPSPLPAAKASSPAEAKPPLKRGFRGKLPGEGSFQPTPEQRMTVEFMTGCGITEADQCHIILHPKSKKPIAPKTLRKHFRAELDRGMTNTNVKVLAGMYKNATTPTAINPGGNPILQMFWAKTRLHWRDRVSLGLEAEVVDVPTSQEQEDPSMNRYDAARRIAFVLYAAAAEENPKGKATPKKKEPA